MANFIIDNTYFVNDSGTSALAWQSGTRVNAVVIYCLNTSAVASFILGAGSPILNFSIVGSNASAIPTTYSIPLYGQAFKTAWIPTTLTACSAWIHMA